EEEALLRSEAVNDLPWLAFHRFLISSVGNDKSTQICYRFTYNQFSVLVQPLLNFKSIELVDYTFRAFLEVLEVGLGPPVRQVSGCVKLCSLIIKPVSHLMADHGTHATIVVSVVSIRVEERRLENAGRKNYFVDLRVVVSIDGGRRHSPFHSVDGLTDLCQVASLFESSCACAIQDIRSSIDFHRGIVAPFVRVADLVEKRVELLDSLLASRFTHPRQGGDIALQGCFKVVHHV